MSGFEAADSRAVSTGEGSFLMSEKLALQQVFI
jgi:hypothetical protein